MGRFLFGLLILLTFASDTFAHGSIARGYVGNQVSFVTSKYAYTVVEARNLASAECMTRGMTFCENVLDFENSCAAVASTLSGSFSTGTGQNSQAANENAIAACTANHRTGCIVTLTACDFIPAYVPAQQATSPEPSEDTESPSFNFDFSGIFRAAGVANSMVAIAGAVATSMFVWLFGSILSTTPSAILKRKAALSAWIGGPAALAFLLWFSFPVPFIERHMYFYAAAVLWTNVFAALSIGVTLRRLLSFSPAPDPLSLPLATVPFAIITSGALYLFIQFGIFAHALYCETPHSLLSACGYYDYEPIYVVAATLLLVIICGAALPANSNLILGYDRLTPFARKRRSAFGQEPRPLTHSDHFEQAAPKSRTARPQKESTEESAPWGEPPTPTQTEEPQLDKRAVKEAFQRKRQQFDL